MVDPSEKDLNHQETLAAEFGDNEMGLCTSDYALAVLPEVQRGLKLILKCYLSDGFIIEMGISGYPMDIQPLFCFALSCARMLKPMAIDFQWFFVENCILSSLVSPAQEIATMDLVEQHWEYLIRGITLKITYLALEGDKWRMVTGSDPKNSRWSYHNGGSWPAGCIKMGRCLIANRAIELMEQRLSKDGWPEYYDGSIAGYMTAIQNPNTLMTISFEEDGNPNLEQATAPPDPVRAPDHASLLSCSSDVLVASLSADELEEQEEELRNKIDLEEVARKQDAENEANNKYLPKKSNKFSDKQKMPEKIPLEGEELGPNVAGLRNAFREHNCFLNVIIQSLWNLRLFRDELMKSHAHIECFCVVCELISIFADLNISATRLEKKAVDPTSLRKALSKLDTPYQMGEMNDASEVLNDIFKCLHQYFSSSLGESKGDYIGPWDCVNPNCVVHRLFGMNICKKLKCEKCDLESSKELFTTFFQYVTAFELREMKSLRPNSSFVELLKNMMNHQLTCDTEKGGCGEQQHIHQSLSTPPHFFTTVLIWQTHVNVDDISATLKSLSTEIDLAALYPNLGSGAKYCLVSVVCYYGRHYICFIYSQETQLWIKYDDEKVTVIGCWGDVIRSCEQGQYQPMVLFFEATGKEKDEDTFQDQEEEEQKIPENTFQDQEEDGNPNLEHATAPPDPALAPDHASPLSCSSDVLVAFLSPDELEEQEEELRNKIDLEEVERKQDAENEAKEKYRSKKSNKFSDKQKMPEQIPLEGEEFGPNIAGLKNAFRENNCFLNVIVQSLWNLKPFRDELMKSHAHPECPCLICALIRIFADLSISATWLEKKAVDPTSLRMALSKLNTCYQMGEMNDASELLENIFEYLHQYFSSSLGVYPAESEGHHIGSWDCVNPKCLVHRLFGMKVHKLLKCEKCDRESRKELCATFFHYATTFELREMKSLHPNSSFVELLKNMMNHQHTCDTEKGGCGELQHIHQRLSTPPHFFTIVLIWQTRNENVDDISATLRSLSTEIDLAALYPNLVSGKKYCLVSVVCYYGLHYICFTYSQETQLWIKYDDEKVTVIGCWGDVIRSCEQGQYQPQVLFFEATEKEKDEDIFQDQEEEEQTIPENLSSPHTIINIGEDRASSGARRGWKRNYGIDALCFLSFASGIVEDAIHGNEDGSYSHRRKVKLTLLVLSYINLFIKFLLAFLNWRGGKGFWKALVDGVIETFDSMVLLLHAVGSSIVLMWKLENAEKFIDDHVIPMTFTIGYFLSRMCERYKRKKNGVEE